MYSSYDKERDKSNYHNRRGISLLHVAYEIISMYVKSKLTEVIFKKL